MKNETRKTRDLGTKELIRSIVLFEIENEFEEMTHSLTQEEFDGDLNLQITDMIIRILKSRDFPEDFWMSIFFSAEEGDFLKEAIERFDIRICIKPKNLFLVPFPEENNFGGAYA